MMSCTRIGASINLIRGEARDIPTLTPQTTVRGLAPFFVVLMRKPYIFDQIVSQTMLEISDKYGKENTAWLSGN